MKNLTLILSVILLISCGPSDEEIKQHRIDSMENNIKLIQEQGKKTVDSLDNLIDDSKTADSLEEALKDALGK